MMGVDDVAGITPFAVEDAAAAIVAAGVADEAGLVPVATLEVVRVSSVVGNADAAGDDDDDGGGGGFNFDSFAFTFLSITPLLNILSLSTSFPTTSRALTSTRWHTPLHHTISVFKVTNPMSKGSNVSDKPTLEWLNSLRTIESSNDNISWLPEPPVVSGGGWKSLFSSDNDAWVMSSTAMPSMTLTSC